MITIIRPLYLIFMSGALEKILRLLQSIFQILAAFAPDITSQSRCLLLRRQFALGRRHFRFFKFLDCFRKAYAVLGNVREDKGAEHGWQDSGIRTEDVEVVLGVGKWGFMGAYLGCESATFVGFLLPLSFLHIYAASSLLLS